MPTQQTGTASAGATVQSLTAQDVIDMFAEFNLPVCDDGDRIKEAFEARRDLYLRYLTRCDPAIRAKGERGFRVGEALQNRRPELLKIVYQHFVSMADAALSEARAMGETKLTKEMIENLREKIAMKGCGTDDQLADRFVHEYLRERLGVVCRRIRQQ